MKIRKAGDDAVPAEVMYVWDRFGAEKLQVKSDPDSTVSDSNNIIVARNTVALKTAELQVA